MIAHFDRYVALGDSISIDLYPGQDAGRRGAPVPGLGAASLLHRNDDARWSEFRGRDLATLVPGIAFRNEHALAHPARYPSDNLTTDGATTGDVLSHQLPRLERSRERTLVTITAGGNDLLMMLNSARRPKGIVEGAAGRLGEILDRLAEILPDSLVLLGTIYDPSDGTNDLGYGPLETEAGWLRDLNAHIRDLAARREHVRLADIHRHFLGHGLTAPERERWYWSGLIVEPGLRGASEVRRVWLEAIDGTSASATR